MSQGRKSVVEESTHKGIVAGATVAGAVVVGALGFPILAGLAAIPATALTWSWWKHRSKNGIKF
ncbi:MAG: hypothetical protein HOV80_16450 [Polyangiaceae bacterium]|nr:hypothetical protein [Polyangiaceae bacterium]